VRRHPGRTPILEREPELEEALERLVDPATRGDPESPLRWTSKSGAKLAQALREMGHDVVELTVLRLLKAKGYEPTVNPVEELLSLGTEVTGLKDVLRSRVAALSDPEWVTTSKLAVEDVRAVVSAYERALDRCERTLTNMLRLDLEARRVQIAEMIWRAIAAGLAAIGGSDRAQTFRAAFAEDLREAA
jgi:hypothetical protein